MTQTTYTLTVNYSQSVEDAIRAGEYDWASDYFTSQNFPPSRRDTEKVQVYLVHFGRMMTSDEVEKEFDLRGLRPATIEELLALGSQHPDIQQRFPIIALGSFCVDSHGDRRVPGLWSRGRDRRASVGWLGGWDSGYRFLAVSR